jgi:pentatricopeptide repeat protein
MQINQMAIKFSYNNDLFIVNALLNMYDEIGSSVLARKLFDITTVRDAVLWNSMICAYIEHGFYEAIDVFNRMQEEISLDERTIVALLSVCLCVES